MTPTSQRLDLNGVRHLLDDLVTRRQTWTAYEQRRYDELAQLETELLDQAARCSN